MRSDSIRMLELTDAPKGRSTREIIDVLWPDINTMPTGKERDVRLQRLLSKTRNTLIVHEDYNRVSKAGYSYGYYNNVRSICWKITPYGRDWLKDNTPEKIAARKAEAIAEVSARAAKQIHKEQLLEAARESYGPRTSPAVRREVSRLLHDEGISMQAIADVFGVTRQLISIDCRGTNGSHKLSLEERFMLLAERWMSETAIESSISRKVDHPAYQTIIAMGRPVVPLILRRLQQRPEHWFVALYTILGEDHARGKQTVIDAAQAWVEWGLEEGLINNGTAA